MRAGVPSTEVKFSGSDAICLCVDRCVFVVHESFYVGGHSHSLCTCISCSFLRGRTTDKRCTNKNSPPPLLLSLLLLVSIPLVTVLAATCTGR